MSNSGPNGALVALLATGLLSAAGVAANARRGGGNLPGPYTRRGARSRFNGAAPRSFRRQRMTRARRRIGSRANRDSLSGFQKRLQHVAKTFKHNPEAVIRTQEIVLTLAQDRFNVTGSLGQTVHTMLDDVRYDGDKEYNDGGRDKETGRLIRPDADLSEYVDIAMQLILDNEHFAQFSFDEEGNGGRTLDLRAVDQGGRYIRSKYEILVPWIAVQMNRLVKSARKGKIQPIYCPNTLEFDLEGYPYSDADHAILQGMSKIMSGDPCFDPNAVSINSNIPERGIALIADWYGGIVDQAKIRNRPIGEFVGDVEFDDDGNIVNEGTYERVEINKLSFEQAVERAVASHYRNSIIANARRFVGAAPTYVMSGGWGLRLLDPNSEAGHRATGARIGNIDTSKDFADESSYLGHCLGTTKFFRDQALRGTHAYYSIRNEQGLPRFTFEIKLPTETNPKANVLQLKGQCDVKPTARHPGGWGNHCDGNFGGGNPGTPFEEIYDTQKITEAMRLLMPMMTLDEVIRTGHAGDLGGVKRVYGEHLDRMRELARYTNWQPEITPEVSLRLKAEPREALIRAIIRHTRRPRGQQAGEQMLAQRQQAEHQRLATRGEAELLSLLAEKVNPAQALPWTADMWQTYQDYHQAKAQIDRAKKAEEQRRQAAAQQGRRAAARGQGQPQAGFQGQANRVPWWRR